MNRWSGSKEDSDRQQGERNQRAARRYLSSNAVIDISLNDSEIEFLDCEETPLINVDGADEVSDEDDSMATEAAAAAAHRAAELLKPFEDQNFPDDEDAWKKTLSFKFNRNDPQFWINNVEAEMTSFGINLQWSRRNALMAKDILPEDVIEELKPLLRLSKTDAGPYIYKTLKEEILTLFAPKEENAYEKAAARRLTTRPSALGKLLINDICPGVKPFENCHCFLIRSFNPFKLTGKLLIRVNKKANSSVQWILQ